MSEPVGSSSLSAAAAGCAAAGMDVFVVRRTTLAVKAVVTEMSRFDRGVFRDDGKAS